MRKLLSLCLVLLLLPAAALAERTLTLTFVGDCTIGGEERVRYEDYSFDAYLARYGYDYLFKGVQSVIGSDDLTIANLEGVFKESESDKVTKTYNFRGPKHFVNVLTSSSIEAVSIANNHSLDYGPYGQKQTILTLDTAGVPWFGTNNAIHRTWIYENGNVRIGFFAAEPSHWFYNNRELIISQMNGLKDAGCQVIVAIMHGGQEYSPRRVESQEKFAQRIIEYGADIVVGHHPHVLQGIDVVNGRTICYSLGNFVFGGNAKIRAPYTAIFQFTLHFEDDGKYLGHQLNIIPALPSGERDYNNYQPVLATGKDAQAVMDQIQYDTRFTLNPYVEGVGAMQDFVPAP